MNTRAQEIYEFGPFHLDAVKRILLRGEQRVRLTAKLFDLLLVLVRKRYSDPEHVVEKKELIKPVWAEFDVESQRDIYVESYHRLLTNCISRLREALNDNRDAPIYIETIPTVGYRLIPDVVMTTKLDKHVVAVLPFGLMGDLQTTDEYLGIGIASALITRLNTIKEIIVRPRSAIFKYTNLNFDPLQAAHELNVSLILVGLIQRDGEEIRVDIEIVRRDDGSLVWSKDYREKLTSKLAVQEALARHLSRDIADSFGWELISEEKDDTTSTEAYQWYVKGRYFWNKFTRADFRKAIECFEQSIKCDPEYGKAYSGLADCYTWLAIYNLLPPKEAFIKAEKWALEALERDSHLAGAYTSLAFISMCKSWDWTDAERGFLRAIKFNRNHTKSRLGYAIWLAGREQFDAAISEINTALEIYSVSCIINVVKGLILYLNRRYEEGLDQLFEALLIDPNFDGTYFCQSLIYVQLARNDREVFTKAIEAAKAAIEHSHDNPLNKALLSYVYAMAGETSKADELLDELKKIQPPHYISPFHIALIHAAKGEMDQAFEWLEKACENKDPWLVLLRSEPRAESLRKDPRFEVILQKIGLA
jgi:DNA-binding winged helix-turn-helix (wHTH) protein/TolB-like protein/Tfp pilus assembly protein PilF